MLLADVTDHSFEAVAVPHTRALYKVALRMTRHPQRAEDLVQDVMLRAFRFWDKFEPGTNCKAWLFRILKNTHINQYHRRGRRRAFEVKLMADVRSLGQTEFIVGSSPPGADAACSTDHAVRLVRRALTALPPDYRRAVELADLEGFSYKEIAEEMDCPIGTVMSRVHRGRKALQKLLAEHAAEVGLVGPAEQVEQELRGLAAKISAVGGDPLEAVMLEAARRLK